ncbi:MAG: hypothetical protein ACREI2_10400 [Nitrospiraceae bacterium]
MTESSVPPDVWLHTSAKRFTEVAATQGAEHIKPLHNYFALRLVIEGGFLPDEVSPSPPLSAEYRGGAWFLTFDQSRSSERELVVLGGLKSKRVDVVVSKDGVGPVLAISIKGTRNAFRNLVNRAEEAIGDSANLHLMYPGLVYGFAHFLQATRAGTGRFKPNDIALDKNGDVVPAIRAYANGLEGLAGRRFLRNEYARYEAVSLALIHPSFTENESPLLVGFPSAESPIKIEKFFPTLYQTYDLRFPLTYTDPSLKHLARVEWSADSPALEALKRQKNYAKLLGYRTRVS